MLKIVILGKNSFLGKALEKEFSKQAVIDWIESKEIDFTDPESIQRLLIEKRPDYVLNCIAIAAVDYAEQHAKESGLVNAQFPKNLGTACQLIGCKGIHFSTDYVFDGVKNTPYLETDVPNPLSIYGKTKLEGERNFLSEHPLGLVLRTAWLFGEGKPNFIVNYIDALLKKKPIKVIHDQVGSPTVTKDVASYTNQLKDQTGVFHVVNRGSASRKDCLDLICHLLQIPKEDQEQLIQVVSVDSLDLLAKRPKFSSLDTSKMDTILDKPSRSWQIALKEFIE